MLFRSYESKNLVLIVFYIDKLWEGIDFPIQLDWKFNFAYGLEKEQIFFAKIWVKGNK